MRVAHLSYSDLLPGAASAAYRLHRGLKEVGIESRFVTALRLSDDESVIGPEGRRATVRAEFARRFDRLAWRVIHGVPRRLQRRPVEPEDHAHATLAVFGSGMLRAALDYNPDVIQLHWIGSGLIRLESLRAARHRPVVWRMADMWPFTGARHYESDDRWAELYRDRPRLDVDRWMIERKRRVYDRLPNLTLVAPSRWLADCARRSPLFEDRPIEIIATGTDLDTFRPLDRREARARLGLRPEAPLVACGAVAATSDPRKGAAHLAPALDALLTRRPDVEIVSFGGDARDRGPRRHELGRLDDTGTLALVYSAADVFVSPSLQDNLPNTVLEAMACGTPVIAFDTGGLPDAIDHRVTGYLARPFDVGDLAAGIEELLELGSSDAEKLRERVRNTAETRFDPRISARRYATLYRELTEDHAMRNRGART